ncbi:uncharacterized protein [Dermacentor albipictus]|uniref:uncharacterized protein n=1 Tax=Dermacentor albipictus TaxID=60249 RepID=UPI0038FC4AD6
MVNGTARTFGVDKIIFTTDDYKIMNATFAYTIYQEDVGPNIKQSPLSDVSTNGTFCREPSGVIFVEFQGSLNPGSMVKGTAGTFGVDGVYFTDKDLTTMNTTFAKCEQGK